MAKPKGWRAFDSLAKQLAHVPKDEVDAKIETDKAKRIAKRKIVAILSLSVDLPGAAMFWRRFERGRRQSRRAWRKHTCKGEGYV